MNSYRLYQALEKLNLLEKSPTFWWPDYGKFKVIIGAILTQQTKWQKVEESLTNLQNLNAFSIDNFLALDIDTIKLAIKPSGFYNQKAPRLYKLIQNIKRDFISLNNFKNSVTREWLLDQKGIGFETADSILCYFAQQEVMVVDNYTNKLLKCFNYEFESYDELQEWIEAGINQNFDKIQLNHSHNITLHEIYANFHGMIVEYCKSGCKNCNNLGIDNE